MDQKIVAQPMKIALVHDWLNALGGAERVLIELHKIFPDAPIYTLFYDRKFKDEYLPNAEIRPSFLQKFHLINKHYKYAALLMPSAIESFDLSNFDLVVSSSVFFSKGLVLRPKTRHICYCYSPTRQLWGLHSTYNLPLRQAQSPEFIEEQPKTYNFSTKLAQHLLRLWDRQAADRVDEFVAISEAVRARIKKYYKREASVIYPPFSLNSKPEILNSKQTPNPIFQIPNNYYLIVSRLYPHKNIDVAIETFGKLNLPLVIIGNGPEKKRLLRYCATALQTKNIKFLGFVHDEKLPYYYQNCRAFIMPQEEDFGLTPLEAMSFGKPVLALRKGGALETVLEGVTGEFFDDPIPEALADGVRRLNENYHNYQPNTIKAHASKFSKEIFRKKILELTK